MCTKRWESGVPKRCLTRHIHMALKNEAVLAFLLRWLQKVAETKAQLWHTSDPKLQIRKAELAFDLEILQERFQTILICIRKSDNNENR